MITPSRVVLSRWAACCLALAACDDGGGSDANTAGDGAGGESAPDDGEAGGGAESPDRNRNNDKKDDKSQGKAGAKAPAAGAGGSTAGAAGKKAEASAGKGGAGGAAGGKTGAGGASGGSGGSVSTAPRTKAAATLASLALDGSEVYGDGDDAGVPVAVSTESATASFSATAMGVRVEVKMVGCDEGGVYPIHIHEGTSCQNIMTQGPHWGGSRGAGIPDIQCAMGMGSLDYIRFDTDPALAWAIGGGANNILGHVLVIQSPYDPAVRIACGKIE